ncbi:phosphatase [Coprinopsis sp. MPI-PUGE-AT-0042]|nr:phosphatase [Coprinopsis sp. MPI-PUGE-AT-0042]
MDSTLLSSEAGVRGAWREFKKTYPDIDIDDILSRAHGVRTVDNLRTYCGVTDPVELEEEALRFENAIVATASDEGGQGIIMLPGVEAVMQEIGPRRFGPKPLWAICTSATRAYAQAALAAAKIPVPDIFVAAEDVTKGKPHPDPYLVGAERCGVDPAKCVVFEDAPAGILSGNAAGCKTIGLLTSHSKAQVEGANPTFIVKDLSFVTIRALENGVEVTIKHD